MLAQIVVICLLPAMLLAEPATVVLGDAVRPRALSPDAYAQRISDFWTPEKLRQAQSVDVILLPQARRSMFNSSVATGPQVLHAGSVPANGTFKSKAISANGRQVVTTGRVFWQSGTSLSSCSAVVVISQSADLIVTAGHCVYDTTSKVWYNNNNWVFIPGYSNGNAPYGKWPMRRVIALQAWTNSADFNYDVAFVALGTWSGRRIQQYLGSQGIGFNMPRPAFIYSFGYPINLNSGQTLQQCSGTTSKSAYTQNNFRGDALPCAMGPGCSGGPWLQNVVDSTGIGHITSVNSFTITNRPNVMNGPYFDANTKILYDTATSM